MNTVQKIEHEPEVTSLPAIVTPMAMLDRAVSSGASMEVLERLMALQERWDAAQARKAFDAAVSAAKAEIPVVGKNSTGHNAKKYADFAAIARVVDPVLGKHGLSYRFRTRQDERIHVTCVLSHRDGHSEETTLAGPADTSGNKNAIQAIGSTLTYLQRYSLVQALGLAAAEDDDGKAAGNGGISDDQADKLKKLTADFDSDAMAALLKYVGAESIEAITAANYDRAIYAIGMKKGKSKRVEE